MTPIEEASEIYQQGVKASEGGNPQLAYDFFLRAVELNPDFSPYRLNLALTSEQLARPAAMMHDLAYFQAGEAVRLAPQILGNVWGFAQIALATHHYKEAIHGYEQCIKMAPENAALWCVLGFAHLKLDHMEDAERCLLRCIELDPELGQAHFMLCTLYTNERHNDAKVAFHGERAFTAKKKALTALEAMWNAAHGFLALGCYEKGFGYFEARLYRNLTNANRTPLSQKFNKPMWKGEKDCRVCIAAEMGLGDCLLLVRYFPIIEKQFGISIIFEGNGTYNELISYNFPTVKVVEHADENDFDYFLPIMSLPFICKTRADSVPWDGPYLFAEPEKIDEWAKQLTGYFAKSNGRPNIGICWSTGSNIYNAANYDVHRKKSMQFEDIIPILELKDINWISLQTGDESMRFQNPGIKTFSDTAAILSQLDGVITVDTALANLAGAMGVMTWLCDRFDYDWRYFSGLKTPWYPTIFPVRQIELYDWKPVVQGIIGEMRKLTEKKAA